MKAIQMKYMERYANENKGEWKERLVALQIAGETEHAKDSVPFDIDSDIKSLKMSVKSERFTLVSARLNYGETLEEKINDYTARTASTQVAYVTNDLTAYIMTLTEFANFLRVFGNLERESDKNGGGMKVRCKCESKQMREWFKSCVA